MFWPVIQPDPDDQCCLVFDANVQTLARRTGIYTKLLHVPNIGAALDCQWPSILGNSLAVCTTADYKTCQPHG